MKKFFSLVLALVMALSLTTVAWGAPVPVANDTELKDAIAAGATEIVLGAGEFTVDLYNIAARDSLTITGQGAATKLNFKHGQVRLELFNSFTISNCTIGRMVDKSWGQLVFSTGKDGGVYTVSNCIFNGESTQGIYMNPANGNEKYVIEGCTFTGDFGIEGAITVQNNSEITTLTVSDDNVFNVDDDSEELTIHYHKSNLTLNSAVDETVLIKAGDGATATENFERAVASADAGDTFKLVENVDLTALSNPVEITDPINIDDNGKTLTGLAAGSNITTDANGKITGGTFETLPDESLLADGVAFVGNTVSAPANCNTSQVSMKDCALVDLTNGAVLKSFAATDKATVYKFNDVTTETNGVKVTEYGATVYYFDGAYGLVVAKDYANAQIQLANGSFVYLRGISHAEFVNASGRTSVVVDKLVEAPAVPSCGDATADYAVVGKAAYAATGTTLAYYKGEFILIGAQLPAAPLKAHTFDNTAKWDMVAGEYTGVTCPVCKKNFKVVDSAAGLTVGSYVATANGYVLLGSVYAPVVTPSTDKTVTSAETFDAGIAMYVGMSVMAAAGSVVVLKKRED